MNKSILWLIGLLFTLPCLILSCSETDGEPDVYTDWEERNARYLDSIATVAEANLGNEVGQWKVIRSYKLPVLGLNEKGKVTDNVYCRILAKGEGTESPIFTDSVDAHYRGRYIPLYNGKELVFDESYQNELDLQTAVTRGFKVGEVVAGWTTALQYMKKGDRWEIYIPYTLGYGASDYTTGSSTIPGHSLLIFDLYLQEVIKLRGTPGRGADEAVDAE